MNADGYEAISVVRISSDIANWIFGKGIVDGNCYEYPNSPNNPLNACKNGGEFIFRFQISRNS
jgi:hypothetical protein